MAAFDTHQAVRRLTAAGVDEEPAEAIVEVVGDALTDVATKADIELAVAKMTAELHRALRVQAAWIVGVLVGLATIASTIIALGISLFG